MTKQEAFMDNVDQDQTAQNVSLTSDSHFSFWMTTKLLLHDN